MPRYGYYHFRKFPSRDEGPDVLLKFDEGSNPWRPAVTTLAEALGGAAFEGDREKGEVCRCVLPDRQQAEKFVRVLHLKYGLRGEIEPVWDWKSEKCVTVYEARRK